MRTAASRSLRWPACVLAGAIALTPLRAADMPVARTKTESFVKDMQRLQDPPSALNNLFTVFGKNGPIPNSFGLITKIAELLPRLAQGDFKGVAVDGAMAVAEWGLGHAAEAFALAKAANVIYAAAQLGKAAGQQLRGAYQASWLESAYKDYVSTNGWASQHDKDLALGFYLDQFVKAGLADPGAKSFPQPVLDYFSERLSLERQAQGMMAGMQRETEEARTSVLVQALPKMYPGLKTSSAESVARLIVKGQVTSASVLGILSDEEIARVSEAGPVQRLKEAAGGSGASPTGSADQVVAYIQQQLAGLSAGSLLYGTFLDNMKKTGLNVDVSNDPTKDRARIDEARKSAGEQALAQFRNSGFTDRLNAHKEAALAALAKMEALAGEQQALNQKKTYVEDVTRERGWTDLSAAMLNDPEATLAAWQPRLQKARDAVLADITALSELLARVKAAPEVAQADAAGRQVIEAANTIPGIASIYFGSKAPRTLAELNPLLKAELAGPVLSSSKHPLVVGHGQCGRFEAAGLYQTSLARSLEAAITERRAKVAGVEGVLEDVESCHRRAVHAKPLLAKLYAALGERERVLRSAYVFTSYVRFKDGKYELGGAGSDSVYYRDKHVRVFVPGEVYDPYDLDKWAAGTTYSATVDEEGMRILEGKIKTIREGTAFLNAIPDNPAEPELARAQALEEEVFKLNDALVPLGYAYLPTAESQKEVKATLESEREGVRRIQADTAKLLKGFSEVWQKDLAEWEKRRTTWKDQMSRLRARAGVAAAERAETQAREESERQERVGAAGPDVDALYERFFAAYRAADAQGVLACLDKSWTSDTGENYYSIADHLERIFRAFDRFEVRRSGYRFSPDPSGLGASARYELDISADLRDQPDVQHKERGAVTDRLVRVKGRWLIESTQGAGLFWGD